MKVVFLDFDRVITTRESRWHIDPEKCKLVKRICDKTGAIWDLYYNGQNLDLKENNYEVQEKISKFEGCTSLVG